MGHIFSEKYLKRGNYPVALLVEGLATLQLFQNCFPRILVVFPVFFLVFGAVMLLQMKTLL